VELPLDVEALSKIHWDDEEDRSLYQAMVAQARSFLEGFRWCAGVRALYGGKAVPGVVAVFLAEITPAEAGVDQTLWVVVGDIPSAYLVLDRAPNSNDALGIYIDNMRRWVSAVRAGESTRGLIPVNTDPTPESAEMLASRLDFLEREIV
jgi:hypothetical protein